MPSPPLAYLVADAHLGVVAPHVERRFHAFLDKVPQAGDELLINGDLFDFWFEYRRAILRRPFRTLVALANTRRRGVKVTMIGGNHDRWGGEFWREELGVEFYGAGAANLMVGGRPAFVHHGDGLSERWGSSRILHRVTRLRLTASLFRLLHPDLGSWLAQGVSRWSRVDSTDPRARPVIEQAAARQRAWALRYLAAAPPVDLVILAHTHTPVLEERDGRYYVNPGAFFDGGRYAVIRDGRPYLEAFDE